MPRFDRIGAILLLLIFLHGVGWQIVGSHQTSLCDEHEQTGQTTTADAAEHKHTHHEDCSICRLQRHFSSAEIVGASDTSSVAGTSFRSVGAATLTPYYRSVEPAGGGSRGPPQFLFS